AILIEGGFMDSTVDIIKLRNNTVLANAGKGTAKAVAKYANLKLKSTAPSTPTNLYRVRKSWVDVASQIGAYSVLQSAKDLADKNKDKGYKVFDEAGKMVYDPKPAVEKMYRVRKSWSDVKSQIGAYKELENAKELADSKAKDGYKVFDETGKVVYTPKVATPPVSQMYRVRKTWADVKSQIGAYTDLNNAKSLADSKAKDGYKVFDNDGKVVYTPKVEEPKPQPKPEPKPVTPPKEEVKPEPKP